MRPLFFGVATLATAILAALSVWLPTFAWSFLVVGPLVVWGLVDAFQRGSNIRRNFPVVGSLLRLMESQRHVAQEDLLQPSWEGRPFTRLQRRIVEKRATGKLMSEAFGTETDYAAAGHDWMLHSLYPSQEEQELPRVRVGEGTCDHPYDASLLNVSGMSFGSISDAAVRALGGGAAKGGFALNTGEGGLTDHHLESGADLIFQIGTGYFGCRTKDGGFDPDAFRERAVEPRVKMIEIKISQGAKPGFGAILPASKNNEEVARYRTIEPHEEVHSPAYHREFSTDSELLEFVDRLRALSGGKPVGVKICWGRVAEMDSLCDAMATSGRHPDFFTVAGGEGGTGAGELDSIHHVGAPAERNLVAWDAALRRAGVRDEVRIFVAGKVISGFDIARYIALGADGCFAARGMMFALGCVQSLKCNTNRCPTGITTMKRSLVAGLVVSDKIEKVARYHHETLEGLRRLLRAAGLTRPSELTPEHFERRLGPKDITRFDRLYDPPA